VVTIHRFSLRLRVFVVKNEASLSSNDALVKRGLLVLPLPVAVMGRRRQYREPDFVVCYKGKAGILQINSTPPQPV
jgi:hypothetical protein